MLRVLSPSCCAAAVLALLGRAVRLPSARERAACQDEAREYYKIKVDQMITVGLLPVLDYYAKQEYVLEKVPPSSSTPQMQHLKSY